MVLEPSERENQEDAALEPVQSQDFTPPSEESPVSEVEVSDGLQDSPPSEPQTAPAADQPSEEGIAFQEKRLNPLHVKLQTYDGPLDLLLDLIKKNEMDIYNIPIAEITRQYLEHLAEMRKLDLEVAGEFLVIAATLIYIKSKMLLPQENEVEEDESGDDPRQELVRKLLEYQAFREAAKELGFLESERGKTFSRQIADYYLAELDPEDAGIDTFSANLFDLLTAFQNVLVRSGKNLTHEVFEEVISIEEKIAEVSNLLNRKQKVLFSELFKTRWTRNELIATFLALLEIVRTKIAFVKQDNQFGEIIIEKREEAA